VKNLNTYPDKTKIWKKYERCLTDFTYELCHTIIYKKSGKLPLKLNEFVDFSNYIWIFQDLPYIFETLAFDLLEDFIYETIRIIVRNFFEYNVNLVIKTYRNILPVYSQGAPNFLNLCEIAVCRSREDSR